MEKLADLLIREGKQLQEDFDKASSIGEGTPQEIAEFRENAFRNFISRFYPLPYRVTKGKIYDSFNNEPSLSVDCLVVNPAHPNLIDISGKFQLLLADGIDFAIELKPNLTSREELERGLKQGISVKRLRRARSPLLLHNRPGITDAVMEISKQIPYFIFGTRVKKSVKDTVNEIVQYYSKNSTNVIDQIDAIIINRYGIIKNVKISEFFLYTWDIPKELKTGWFFEKWEDTTLVGMLLSMAYSYHSIATIQESILKRYMKKFHVPNVERIC